MQQKSAKIFQIHYFRKKVLQALSKKIKTTLMGYFGSKLAACMGRNKLTFKDLSERTGLAVGTLNGFTLGKVESPDRETVEKIISAFPQAEDVYDLTIAHLEDEIPNQGRALVKLVKNDEARFQEHAPPYIIKSLDARFEAVIERIRAKCQRNRGLYNAMFDIDEAT